MNVPGQPVDPVARVRLDRRCVAGCEVAYLEIDEPRRLNVLDSDKLDTLLVHIDSMRNAAAAGELRALVLRGAGARAFCGGADLRELSRLDEDGARAFITRLHRVCRALRELPVPVVAAIRGYCLGAGLELAASCDIRVATSDAVFGMPEVRVGIPSVIEAALLPGIMGWGRAREMMLTGRTYDAAEALAIGLVEEVTAPEGIEAAVDRRLHWIGDASARAISAQKALFSIWESQGLERAIEAGIQALAAAYRDAEPRSRMRAFLDGGTDIGRSETPAE